MSDEQKEDMEAKEVEEIAKEGEIMQLATPEDEASEDDSGNTEE